MEKGTWQIAQGAYTFVFDVHPKAVLYGRTNPSVSDSISIRVGLDGNRGFALRTNAIQDGVFIPVFNEGANCFSYPYNYKQETNIKNLEVFVPSSRQYAPGEVKTIVDEIYHFKITENYNDFLLTGLPESYTTPKSFQGTFTDGILYLDGTSPLKKRGEIEEFNGEDAQYLKHFLATDILPQALHNGIEFFPYYDDPRTAALTPFTKIPFDKRPAENVTLSENSLFTARCED